MPAKLERCVRAVKRKGSAVSPYAVCTTALKNPSWHQKKRPVVTSHPTGWNIVSESTTGGGFRSIMGPFPSEAAARERIALFKKSGSKDQHFIVPPARSKNPEPRADVDAAIAEAQKRFKSFTGREATTLDRVRVSQPKVALTVGLLDGVPYTTIREGKVMQYMHWFKKRARPLLAVSSDGRSISIVGGRFRFTDAGFVDET